MGYENAPATKLVATHCAMCGKQLVDAESLKWGIGPVCRRRFKKAGKLLPEAVRRAANKIIYDVAVFSTEGQVIEALALAQTLRDEPFELGVIVDRIEKRLVSVKIVRDGDHYLVRAPYNEFALNGWRKLGKWSGDKKLGWKVPAAYRVKLWKFLCTHYAGENATSEKGVFQVPSDPTESQKEAA